MLDGVDFHRPLNERGCALDGLHMDRGSLDDRFVGKIDTLEFEPVANRRGQEGKRDILSGVESTSGQACGGCEGALVGHDEKGSFSGLGGAGGRDPSGWRAESMVEFVAD